MPGATRRATIARLNDHLRFTGEGGWTYLSRGVAALPIVTKEAVIRAVRHFAEFTPDNDPHGEHDCAVLTVEGHRIVWKIDYHARNDDRQDAFDPTDPTVTKRVMTIMLAEEY
ncbi:DUF3768 domain-containing protein [Sphingomonas baiyangensis]|uniref:DUF3768 domain-containing protein n=1 Tax=Sphingomonas baiyangensis TaxID=2572576 RepID=A0A4U1L229_9SPHN|nr:DUF3768 domain-containing protein [Sphingomonas baiyangensis]TKD50270.1 DUF3768 domain-containing protein [Sphingomonas baiyangensis]